jgi:hypothetical protein
MRVAASLLAVAGVSAVAVASAGAATVQYSNLPSPLPGNVPSVGFQATSAAELGGQVQFAGTVTNPTVVVGMSSWACQSGGAEDGTCVSAPGSTYNWPITLNVYEVGPGESVGAKIVTLTQTFAIPYRPSADHVHCAGNGGWYKAKACYHGKLFKITFSRLGNAKSPVTLPAKAIVSVAFNTDTHGYKPTGLEGPWESLNVGLGELATTGSDPVPSSIYWNTTYGPFYCDEGAGGTGTFRLDSGCWTEAGSRQPLIQVKSQ